MSTKAFLGDQDGPRPGPAAWSTSRLTGGRFAEVEGSEREMPADLVLLAMGFTGPERDGVVGQLGVDLDDRGNVAPRRGRTYMTSVPGVFVAGDAAVASR